MSLVAFTSASFRSPWIFAGLVVGAACGNPEPAEPAPGSTGASSSGTTAVQADSSSSSGGGTTSIPDAAPEVIDVGFDAEILREGEAIVVTAVVVDPNDDVIAGELLGPDDPSVFGSFEPGLSGRWRITVSWDEVHARWPLEFTNELVLAFVARFVDGAGLETSVPVEIRAVCGGLATVSCDGVCVDIQTSSEHCDGCDSPCVTGFLENWGPTGGCDGGQCRPRWSECADPLAFSTCTEICAAAGARCAAGGCMGETSMAYLEAKTCEAGQAGPVQTLECDTPLPGPLGFEGAIRCCCG